MAVAAAVPAVRVVRAALGALIGRGLAAGPVACLILVGG